MSFHCVNTKVFWVIGWVGFGFFSLPGPHLDLWSNALHYEVKDEGIKSGYRDTTAMKVMSAHTYWQKGLGKRWLPDWAICYCAMMINVAINHFTTTILNPRDCICQDPKMNTLRWSICETNFYKHAYKLFFQPAKLQR